jgi:hypothetical protein
MEKVMLVAVMVGGFSRTGREGVVANINILLGNAAFPDAGWSDFPAPILGWWLDALDAMAGDAVVDLEFMDGPYAVRVSPLSDPGHVRMLGRNLGGPPSVVESRVVASLQQLREAVVDAGWATLAVCDERGWRGGDIEDLRDRLHRRRSPPTKKRRLCRASGSEERIDCPQQCLDIPLRQLVDEG